MSLTEAEVAAAATDQAAVDRFHGGDWAAFDELYERYRDRLLRYCQYRLRDRHEAEDVAQEAFVRAWRSMPTFAGDRNFYPWLRVIAANLCTDVLRKRSRSQPAAEVDLGAVQEADRLEQEDDRQLVRQALARLNARHQSALLMREDEGLAYDEIAERTGVSTATVESLLWRARQAFRREFTVLSAGQACLAILVLPAALAGRFRDMLRSVAGRMHQRLSLAAFMPVGDGSSFHPAALTTAGVAVATVVAAAVGITSTAPAPTAHVPSTIVAPPPAIGAGSGPAGPGGAGATTATTAGPIATVNSVAKPASPATSAVSPTGTAGSGPALRPGSIVAGLGGSGGAGTPKLINPVATTGQNAAQEARNDPVSVSVGPLVVGMDPAAVTTYVQSTASKLSAPAGGARFPAVCVPIVTRC